MRGRFTLLAPGSAVAKEFGLFDIHELTQYNISLDHYNISPGQSVIIVRQRADLKKRVLAVVN